MSNLAALRERALHHLTSRQVRYPVCLDPATRMEMRTIAERMAMVAEAAATALEQALAPAKGEDEPARRTIGDAKPAKPTLEELEAAAEKALAPMRDRTGELLRQAAADDQLVVVVFGLPEVAKRDPAGFYAKEAAKFQTPTLQRAEFLRHLVVASYLRTEAPDGQDLDMKWSEVSTAVLNHADLESLDQNVLELYREPSSIPFDPANYGEPPLS